MTRSLLGLLLAVGVAVPVAHAEKVTILYSPLSKAANTTDAQTDTTLWTPASGNRVILQGCTVSADATETVKFEVADVVVIPVLYLAANTSVTVGFGGVPIYVGATDAILTYTTTTSANTSVMCSGWEDAF